MVALGTPKDIARQILELVVTTRRRTLNHRPRKDRNGRSRVDLHLDHEPTSDEIGQEKQAFAPRIRRQELARQSFAARQDPEVRRHLAEGLARLGFADPDGQLLSAIARYPLDAVIEGIAIVEGFGTDKN